MNLKDWSKLSAYLKRESKSICQSNGCKRGEHNCESYAYIAEDGCLIDVCYPDFFQGWGSADEKNHGGYAAISLPWSGTGRELKEAVHEQSFVG